VRTMLGSVDRSYVFRLIEALALGDGRTVVETVETLRLNGLSAASTLEEMATVLQRMAVLQTMGLNSMDGDEESDTEVMDTARLAALLPADETQLLYSICLHGRGDLGLAPDEYAALTMVLLRLLAFKPPAPQGERAAMASNAPPVEKKTLNSAFATLPTTVQRPATAVSAHLLQAPVGAQRTVQPWEDHPETPDLAAPVWSEPLPRAALTPRVPVPAQALGSAAKTVAVAAAVYSQSGAVPPGHILPVRASFAGDDALEGAAERGEGDEGTLAVPRRAAPVDHRVVGVPVRQQTESRADASAAAQATPVLIPTEEGDFWHATVQSLVDAQAIGAMVRELALQSQLVARDEGQWLLRVERESLNQSGSRDRLMFALKDAGFDVALAVEVGRVTDSPGRRNASASAERQVAAEQLIYATPLVQNLMRDFGAKVVPGSIRPL